jgi:hypothetical protein
MQTRRFDRGDQPIETTRLTSTKTTGSRLTEGNDVMAASRIIEEESGTYTGRIRHAHNGYYAGDFSAQPPPTFGPIRPAASRWR